VGPDVSFIGFNDVQDDVGSASWAERQRERAEAARAAAVQQAEAAYRRALADIDTAVAGRAMCLLCCDRPPETVLGPCQHRVCAECLPRLGGKCPWVWVYGYEPADN
jgi:hypothetical protein